MTEDSPNEREPESKQVTGKLLSPEERAVCARLAAGEAPWSQHAQSFLALDAGATQAAAGEQAGLTTGQVKYWLGRFRPQLIRRVIFRDREGLIEMQSDLNDYASLAPGGPLVPHAMTAEWPKAGAYMRFRVGRWSEAAEVEADSIQFATPKACGGS